MGDQFGQELLRGTLIDGILYAGPLSFESTLYAGGLPYGYVTDYEQSVYALRASDGQGLWDYQGREKLLAVAGANGIAYLLEYEPASQTGATLIAQKASDGQWLWRRAIQATGMIFADGALYSGYGGDNQTSGCTPTGPVVGAKLRPADGSQLWRFQS